jgi:hypothetical protein
LLCSSGIDTLNSIRKWIKGKVLKASLYNKALACVAKAATHNKGTVEDGREILEAMAQDGVALSPVALSSFIQVRVHFFMCSLMCSFI